MSNKTSDKNVVNVEEDVKVLKDLMKELKLEKQTALHNNEYGEYITECDVLDLYDMQILALQHILAEREQMLKEKQDDKKDIKDFQNALNEENLRCANYAIENNELKKRIKELEEERNHWHGCFIVAMENSIAKEKVIEAFEDIEDYFDRLNGPDEDMDYIRQVKQELLEGEK